MERDFKDFSEFSKFFTNKMTATTKERRGAVNAALEVTAAFIQARVKEKFGFYQKGWEELSPATKQDRVRQGYTENDPLYRSGELRDSVEKNVGDNSASIGSNNPIMIYQEKGTTRTGWQGAKGIPPRPVFLITHQNDAPEAVSLFVKTLFDLIRA